MNQELSNIIENQYPYPIAVEFRRLLTPEYSKPGTMRLHKILEVTENTAHFLALLTVCELRELVERKQLTISDAYSKEFPGRITRTSMGKWIALLRDSLALVQASGQETFVRELPEFFLKKSNAPAPAQEAFNKLTSLRNNLAHPTQELTTHDYLQACNKAEELLEVILKELHFITGYHMLHIEDVSVEYHRWSPPVWNHSVADAAGHNSAFKELAIQFNELMYTPSAFISRRSNDTAVSGTQTNALSIEPLILRSSEGSGKIKDIFLYQDIDLKKCDVSYKPCDKGGAFSLSSSEKYTELIQGFIYMLKPFLPEKEAGQLIAGISGKDQKNSLLEGVL